MYTPTQEDIKYAKHVNDEIIWKQVLNPIEIKVAFKKLFGYDAVNPQQAKSKVFSYFQYEYKPQPEAIIESIGTIDNLHNQSHQEDLQPIIEVTSTEPSIDYQEKLQGLEEQLRFLSNCEDSEATQLQLASLKKEIKSLKIKIGIQNKKNNNDIKS